MALTLYAEENHWQTKALKAVARYAGVVVNVVTSFQTGDLQGLSPAGAVPTLVTEHGGLFQTNSIARYIARRSVHAPLYGETDFEHALVDGWLDWTREKVEVPAGILLPDPTQVDFYIMKDMVEKLIEDLKVINNHVGKHTWLVGRFMSIADVVAALTIAPIFTDLFGKNHIKPFNAILRWLKTVLDQPGVAAYYGPDFVLCKTSPIPTNPPKREKKEDEKIEVAPDVTYLGEIQTSFPLEDWKTKYANTKPTKPDATDFFWERYDPSSYCMYTFHYKFFTECTVQFKTSNLFGGFLQRSDGIKGMARMTCASMVILNRDGHFHIYGVWLFKGTEMPLPWTENIDDINYYEWEKVDHTNTDHRALVTDYWAWESDNDFGGRGAFVGGKTYGL